MTNPLNKKKLDNLSDEPRKKRKLLSKKTKQPEKPVRVTNDTLETHRQAVIKRGRKFKYPFYHSRHKTIIISSVVLVAALIVFLSFSVIRLYKYKPHDDFSYALTKIIPFPVAKVNDTMVDYKDYLFELRLIAYRMAHSSGVDFSTPDGQKMLAVYERDALNRAEITAYARSIAEQKGITVDKEEVDQVLNSIRKKSLSLKAEAKPGEIDTFNRTIKAEYNWTENDLRHSLQDLLYQQKVIALLDTGASSRANEALQKLSGKQKQKFTSVAREYSDDKSNASNGGVVGLVSHDPNNKANTAVSGIPQQVLDTLFDLKEGEVSGLVQTPSAVYIVKNDRISGDKRQLSYIKVSYQSLDTYIKDLHKQDKVKEYINVPEVKTTIATPKLTE